MSNGRKYRNKNARKIDYISILTLRIAENVRSKNSLVFYSISIPIFFLYFAHYNVQVMFRKQIKRIFYAIEY